MSPPNCLSLIVSTQLKKVVSNLNPSESATYYTVTRLLSFWPIKTRRQLAINIHLIHLGLAISSFAFITMATAPPELRLLTSQLTLPPAQILPRLPHLTSLVLRCREVLLQPNDQKPAARAGGAAGSAAEATALVHRLRSSISSLIGGRSLEGRLVGAALAKAVIDVGGWESLRASDGWVRSLLGVLQVSRPRSNQQPGTVINMAIRKTTSLRSKKSVSSR